MGTARRGRTAITVEEAARAVEAPSTAVRNCRLVLSKPLLKATTVSALWNNNILNCFERLLLQSTCAATQWRRLGQLRSRRRLQQRRRRRGRGNQQQSRAQRRAAAHQPTDLLPAARQGSAKHARYFIIHICRSSCLEMNANLCRGEQWLAVNCARHVILLICLSSFIDVNASLSRGEQYTSNACHLILLIHRSCFLEFYAMS